MGTGDRVFVYWNLHRGCWSVRMNGRVVAHVTELTLRDARFRVSEAGRQRVLRERRKNVHAGVDGYVTEGGELGSVAVSYDPYRGPAFYLKESGAPVYGAARVAFTPARGVFIAGPRVTP